MAAVKKTKLATAVSDTYDRKGFETWATANQYEVNSRKEGKTRPEGMYEQNTTQAAWEGWRAAKGYVAPVVEINMDKVVVTVEHEEEGDGEWSNDMFTVLLNGKEFAYCNGFLDYDSDSKKKIPFNWDTFSTTSELAEAIAKAIDFSGLHDARNPKQAMTFMRKQVKAWLKTPAAKKVVEHFFQWKETGTFATRLRSA